LHKNVIVKKNTKQYTIGERRDNATKRLWSCAHEGAAQFMAVVLGMRYGSGGAFS